MFLPSVHAWNSEPNFILRRRLKAVYSIACVRIRLFCLYVCVCMCVCGPGGGSYYFSLVVAQSCLSCRTSAGCVMGFVERCSVSGVKQAQSRAPPDTTGTSGRSLWGFVHMHICRAFYRIKWQGNLICEDNSVKQSAIISRMYQADICNHMKNSSHVSNKCGVNFKHISEILREENVFLACFHKPVWSK